MKLSDVSPLAGMLTGDGAMGELIRQGVGGTIPAAIARNSYADEEVARAKQEAAEGKKRGGKVSASRRGDGIAQRGKTRGRMV